MGKNRWSRIDGKALLWLTREQSFTSTNCRLLRITIRFVKDRYFHIYVKHAFNKGALYSLHNIDN